MKLAAGHVALVTGGASGIGRAMVEAFARIGLDVVMADVESRALDEAAEQVRASTGARVLAEVVDVRDPDRVTAVAARARESFGPIDVLCANAGVVAARRPVWEQSAADWAWTVEVNLLGVANAVRAIVPEMVRRGSGHVVFTSSIAGLAPLPGGGNGAYAATKHAIVGLAETLRLELDDAAPDVGVTVLCPGPVTTNIHAAARNRPSDRPGPTTPNGPMPTPQFAHGMATVGPDEVAASVIQAIETNRLYLLPGPGTAAHARRRVQRLLADLPPAGSSATA